MTAAKAILLLMPIPNHKIKKGANVIKGITWVVSIIGKMKLKKVLYFMQITISSNAKNTAISNPRNDSSSVTLVAFTKE